MRDKLYTLLYAAVLGTVCALLLTGAGRFTEPYREANAKAEEVRNILAVLEVPFEPTAPSGELLEIFERAVRSETMGAVTAYVFAGEEGGGAVEAVAVPFSGQGVWGPIKGLLALEPDMRTIKGVTFYEQEETPGLGGEIASESFRSQFRGKTVHDAAGNPGIRIVRGTSGGAQNEVDGISGASMTCRKVEEMLNSVIGTIMQESGSDG